MSERALTLSREFRTRGHRNAYLDDPYVVGYAHLKYAINAYLDGPSVVHRKLSTLRDGLDRACFIFTARNVSDVVRDSALAAAGFWGAA